MHRLFILSVILMGVPLCGSAAVIHVPGDEPTIQDGLLAAASGDTVLVSPGSYVEHIVWPDVSGITLLSCGGPDVTEINGSSMPGAAAVRIAYASIDTTSVLDGFTICNGCHGILLIYSAEPKIRNVVIQDNSWYGINLVGAGMIVSDSVIRRNGTGVRLCYGHLVALRNVEISDNHSAESGGGMTITDSTARLYGCTISGNSSAMNGGGLYFWGSERELLLMDSVIEGNTASDSGGGIYAGAPEPGWYGWNLDMRNVVVAGNSAGTAGGLFLGEFLQDLDIQDCVFAENEAQYDAGGIWSTYGGSMLNRLERCTFARNVAGDGGAFVGALPEFWHCTVTQNRALEPSGVDGILRDGTYSPSTCVRYCNFMGNGFALGGNHPQVAPDCFWGDPTGPYSLGGTHSGLGDTVAANVDFEPFSPCPLADAPLIPPFGVEVTRVTDDSLVVEWSPNPTPDLAGYRVYYTAGSSGFPYDNEVDVGQANSCAIPATPGTDYYVAVTCYDPEGNESWYSAEVTATTWTSVQESGPCPSTPLMLHEGRPNPFACATTLAFQLAEPCDVRLAVYNVLGQKVRTLLEGPQPAGAAQVRWDGRTDGGREVANGIYYVRLAARGTAGEIPAVTRKIVLAR